MTDATGNHLLSLATVEWLVDEGRLTPTPASPLGVVVGSKRRTTAEERANAAQRELSDSPSPALLLALDVSSRPEARIRLTTTSAARPPKQITLLRRSDKLVQCGFNTEGYLFGEPMAVDVLVAQLVAELTSEPPSANTTDHLLSPLTLGLLTALWPESHLASTAAVTLAAAEAACKRLAGQDAAARPLIDVLVAGGHLREKDGDFLLDDEWRPWLDRLWSKKYFELETIPLPATEFDPARLNERRERLLFIGPKGQRIVCRAVDPKRLDDVTLAGPPREGQEDPLVALSFLDGEFLAGVLRSLLRMDESGFLRTQSSRPGAAGPSRATSLSGA